VTSIERALKIISRAWGDQEGFAFFPYIDRAEQIRTGRRQAGYNEGPMRPKGDERGPAFRWPQDRAEIVRYLKEHLDRGHDTYWAPSLFEYPNRRSDLAMDEHALWADLDAVDPRDIPPDLQPTIAWESSPDRFQALWIASDGDFQGASWPGNENQRLTYLLEADPSGWDTTQLLRIPGWPNFKPDRVEENGGKAPKGKLLWSTGPEYTIRDFAELPEVRGAVSSELTEALESEIDSVDRYEVIARLKIKLNHTARELINAREVSGDRSGQMWYLMRCLADAGATVTEIVAVIRPSVWNKFEGRADEMKRLIAEASKAIASRSEETVEALEEEQERPRPTRLGDLLRNIKRPVWLIEGVLTEGACGFIAGEPKTWKSWIGYDMALSIATGADFLDNFRVLQPGPVLYIQEEDPPPTLKTRGAKIWVGKSIDKLQLDDDGHGLYWLPPAHESAFDPDINAYVQNGVTISDEAWQLWLDETIEEGMDGVPYKLMVIDTLMMTAGLVDENRAQEMTTRIFKPLKVLARKHNIAIMVVHHLGKSDKQRMGQRMLGSVANHAWAEDSIYLMRSGRDKVRMEFESKVAPAATYKITNLENLRWEPKVDLWSPKDQGDSENVIDSTPPRRQRSTAEKKTRAEPPSKVLAAMEILGPGSHNVHDIAAQAGMAYKQAHRQLSRELEKDLVVKVGTRWSRR